MTQRTDSQVIADHKKRESIVKELNRVVGRRSRHRRSPAFEAGVSRPNPKVEQFRAARAAQGRMGTK